MYNKLFVSVMVKNIFVLTFRAWLDGEIILARAATSSRLQLATTVRYNTKKVVAFKSLRQLIVRDNCMGQL
jgi:hypothetical protein